MRSTIHKLINSSFIRNVTIVASGTAAAQIVTMSLSPFITRLYGPEAFGLLGVFTAIISIVSPIAALSYPISIVLPKSDQEAKGLVCISLYISFFLALLSTAVLLLFHSQIVALFNIESIALYLYFIPLVILFSGILQVIEQWQIRHKQFRIIARVSLLQALFLQGSKVIIGLFRPFASVLIVITVISQLLKAIMLLMSSKKSKLSLNKAKNIKAEYLKNIAIKHKDFPLFRAPQVLINGISQGLPIMMLTTFFGPASAGFYTLGRSVLGVPSQLIGKSVGDVFYPRISEAANNGSRITALIIKATLALGAIGIIPFGIVIIIGPQLFSLVFGSDWVTAGEYARWTALWVFFMFINQPCVKALPVLSAQSFHLKITILMLVVRLLLLALGYYVFSSDLLAIAFYSVSGAVLYTLIILITIRKSINFDSKLEA